jgi:sulfur carrier protein
MQLIVNGEARVAADGISLGDLIDQLGLDRRKVAVERNLEIVPRSLHGETRLEDGDRIEIVQFVGGG